MGNQTLKFFNLFRKRGFSETISILHSFPEKEIVQSKFFEQLQKEKSYANSYFRVKKDLLAHKLIAYKLNDDNEKVIFLTEKGASIWDKVQEIEKLI
ncbi:hypothetical protein NEF87_005029 [Candidatus Lokiarchaeum ossiferum]|uniref:ArnR1-like winged helix-turn-helix domain-containing protein n=1 Tax=Candidatus Lokiarchaeum ossiferum TaxID=2951803 RepID=A0ABY6HYZ5_9ARCH|nr:hypothetical protein NEF87_005029 [Candidatus Lokiarchaeum sp. B-35]